MTATKTVQSTDGTTIAFERIGDGAPLILVLGALCDRGSARGLADILGGDFAVFIYDRRGRGASGDTPPYAVEREIEDLDALINEAGGSAAVFGHSSGAVLVLEAAAHGLPITRVAAYEPPYIVGDTRTRPKGLTERVSALIESGQRGEALKLFMSEGPEIPSGQIAAIEASPGWPSLEAIAHTLPYDLTITGDQIIPTDRLAKIGIPTLALKGGDSPAWARNTVDVVAAAIPGAQLVTLDGQTHAAADDVLAPVLRTFFLS